MRASKETCDECQYFVMRRIPSANPCDKGHLTWGANKNASNCPDFRFVRDQGKITHHIKESDHDRG